MRGILPKGSQGVQGRQAKRRTAGVSRLVEAPPAEASTSRLTPAVHPSSASVLLALAAPLGLWVGAVPPPRDAKGWWRVLMQCAAVLLPAGLAAGLAMAASGE